MKNIRKPPKKVLAIAKKVREALELHAILGGWPKDLEGLCMLGAKLLSKQLNKAGYKADWTIGIYDGGEHCWTIYRDWIIDCTATQFGIRSKVYVVSKHNRHYQSQEFPTKKDRNIVEITWPPWQRKLPRIKI